MADFVFKRYELKYILSLSQYFKIKAELEKRLCPDKFGINTVQSLYYDTADDRMIRTSLEKPVFKEKLRLRCYNLNDNDKDIFIEMKRKYDGVVYKRRISCKEKDAYKIFTEPQNTQIGKELQYFHGFYGTLYPKMLILYDREAFFDGNSDLRVTFDRKVRYRKDNLNFYTSLEGESLVPKDSVLMEIKSANAFPLWLCNLLCAENIQKQSFSKYGAAYKLEYDKRIYARSKVLCLNRFLQTETYPQSVSL